LGRSYWISGVSGVDPAKLGAASGSSSAAVCAASAAFSFRLAAVASFCCMRRVSSFWRSGGQEKDKS